MWILGTYYSQITGYKIDDYTGNLTAIEHSPFGSGGSNPQMLAVKSGGRFLYVLNAGTGQIGTPGQTGYVPAKGSGIAEFEVGGGGELTYQQTYYSQGTNPIYLTFDSSGNYLYVLNQYSPAYCNPAVQTCATPDLNGSVTAFSVAGDTGELTLVQNPTILAGGKPTYYFEVGQNPVMLGRTSSCLYTLSPQSVYPYVISSTSGALSVAATGPLVIGTAASGMNLTSINTSNGGSYTFLTDGGLNQIYSEQTSGTCNLTPVSGSISTNVAANTIPVNSLTSSNGKFLYVINQTTTGGVTSTTESSISAFTINNGQLAGLADPVGNPYSVGSGPVCIVEDPSDQYIYTSNGIDSTVTGKIADQNRGYLSNLSHGSVFPASMKPSCLAVSGNI
jgi:6-phosphogluconolactonase (cycloisomerase 2 family)